MKSTTLLTLLLSPLLALARDPPTCPADARSVRHAFVPGEDIRLFDEGLPAGHDQAVVEIAMMTRHQSGLPEEQYIHVYNRMPDPVTVEVYVPARRRGSTNQNIGFFDVPPPPTPVPGRMTPTGGRRDWFFPIRVAVGTVLLYNVRVNHQQHCG
ncbi:hypothetical protein BDZ85DRAFT_283410 [Elsinoe ampelina]|uniref:Uncharacterized protein n=1 Tax=Elsinoe ampelina TaxID=302913 RepID=A0A6A6G6F6_9PEZI|nr:hypothetical protein BDZ85DRAFT_283410 [Elsinoe ampelina]